MAAAQIATVTEDGVDTVVRFSGKVRLPHGPVSVREIEATGEIVLAPIAPSMEKADRWAAFLDDMSKRPRVDDGPVKRLSWDEFFDLVGKLDVPEEYMAERPMNRLPVERTIFEEG